jgi:hypothetical protein
MKMSWTCWHTPVIPALWRLTQEDGEFEANIGYIVSLRPALAIW